MLCWLHVGDLHITGPDEENLRALREIVAIARRGFSRGVDFLFLPGDNANEGTAAQYALIRSALAGLQLPVWVLPGDHDFEPRSLDAFHAGLRASALPQAETIGDRRCLFLDVVSAGSGGPDFRLGAEQLAWLERELAASPDGAALFMHAYPLELRDCGPTVAELVTRHRVACVAMGHTHYNELANDGVTIYSTVRSTGQVEEGPAGFALTAIDDGVVSWRFRPLENALPLCLITSPADRRLITDPSRQIGRGPVVVRARAWSDAPIERATVRLGAGPERAMTFDDADDVWSAIIDDEGGDGERALAVEIVDAAGRADRDVITLVRGDPADWDAPARQMAGSDANAIGAWAEKGIHGGQLGPNKNGRQW